MLDTVLFVDDDEDLRTMLCLILSAEGYAVASAADGVQALDRLRGEPPALLLVDLMMPRMNGEELIRKMTEDAALARIPIAIMSGQASVLSAAPVPGVVARLVKPVELDEILSVVQRFADR